MSNSHNAALSQETRQLLNAMDMFLESVTVIPSRIPDWMLSGDKPISLEENTAGQGYLACLKAMGRACFDSHLAANLWWDFWLVADEVVGLVGNQLGAPLSFVLNEGGEVSCELRVLRPFPQSVSARLDETFLLVGMYALFGADIRKEMHLGQVGSPEAVMRLVAACWHHSMLRHDALIVSR